MDMCSWLQYPTAQPVLLIQKVGAHTRDNETDRQLRQKRKSERNARVGEDLNPPALLFPTSHHFIKYKCFYWLNNENIHKYSFIGPNMIWDLFYSFTRCFASSRRNLGIYCTSYVINQSTTHCFRWWPQEVNLRGSQQAYDLPTS